MYRNVVQLSMVPLHSTPKNTPRTVEGVGITMLGALDTCTFNIEVPHTVVPRCVPHDGIGSDTIQKSSIRHGTPPPSSTIHLANKSGRNFHKSSLCGIKGRQHPDFPGGHPPEYYPSLRLLNFAERTGYGTISLRWPSTTDYALHNYPCVPHIDYICTHTNLHITHDTYT